MFMTSVYLILRKVPLAVSGPQLLGEAVWKYSPAYCMKFGKRLHQNLNFFGKLPMTCSLGLCAQATNKLISSLAVYPRVADRGKSAPRFAAGVGDPDSG